jgi:hypothetical protein
MFNLKNSIFDRSSRFETPRDHIEDVFSQSERLEPTPLTILYDLVRPKRRPLLLISLLLLLRRYKLDAKGSVSVFAKVSVTITYITVPLIFRERSPNGNTVIRSGHRADIFWFSLLLYCSAVEMYGLARNWTAANGLTCSVSILCVLVWAGSQFALRLDDRPSSNAVL